MQRKGGDAKAEWGVLSGSLGGCGAPLESQVEGRAGLVTVVLLLLSGWRT